LVTVGCEYGLPPAVVRESAARMQPLSC